MVFLLHFSPEDPRRRVGKEEHPHLRINDSRRMGGKQKSFLSSPIGIGLGGGGRISGEIGESWFRGPSSL